MVFDLNDYQRAMLRAIFDTDQVRESYYRSRARRDGISLNGSTWRWMAYNTSNGIDSELKSVLRSADLIRSDIASIWQVLETQKLIQVRSATNASGQAIPEIQITPTGRAFIHSWFGSRTRKPQPKGLLVEHQWAALMLVWQAGENGIDTTELIARCGGFGSLPTIHRLITYTPLPLIEQFGPLNRWYRITDYGRSHYRAHWQNYRERYPLVDAPSPDDE